MQLLNIDDKALIIRDFLPNNILEQVRSYKYTKLKKSSELDQPWDPALYSENKITNKRNLQDVKTVNLIDTKKNYVLNPLFTKIEELILEHSAIPTFKEKEYDFSACYYQYEKNSGINWHDDNVFALNFSLYIHDNWNPDWGGETLIDTGRGLPLASTPFPNTLLCIKENVMHKVCAVTSDVQRKVLQCRYNFKN
tara:strand:+ start:215 stop:799 length:585 start_codon:yes stop_codon:yes gene_type:complete